MVGIAKYDISKEQLVELLDEGLNNREIGRRLEVHHNVIARRLKTYGLVGNHMRGVPPIPVDDTHSLCVKCSQVVPNEDFPYVQGRKDGRRLSYCRKCRYKQIRTSAGQNPQTYWEEKRRRIKTRADRDGINFDLSVDYLVNLWHKQNGKCFYTDTNLEPSLAEGRKQNSPSVDRVDCSQGYVEGNIVICTARVNSMKYDMTLNEMQEWTPGWYQRLVEGGFVNE